RSSTSALRAPSTTRAPCSAAMRAVHSPMPLLALVITITCLSRGRRLTRMSCWWCTRRATRAAGSLEGERARVVGAERDDQRATGEPRRRAFTQDRRWAQALEVQLRAEADARDRGLARPPEHDDDRARALSDA